MSSISKPLLIAVTATVAAGSLSAYAWSQSQRPEILEIYVFDLSSGRSIFVRTPDDKRILFDGGSNNDVIRELTRILPFYSRRLDAIVATNSDGKNVSGLIDVLDRYVVDRAYIPGVTLSGLGLASPTDEIYSTFINSLRKKNIVPDKIFSGQSISFGHSVTVETLFPDMSGDFSYSKSSAPEILFIIRYGDTSVVFIGNASSKIQTHIASSTLSKLTSTNVLIVSNSALPANISKLMSARLQPQYLVYSKLLTKANTSAINKIADPLASISDSRRFNIHETGTVNITSDGIQVKIIAARTAKSDR